MTTSPIRAPMVPLQPLGTFAVRSHISAHRDLVPFVHDRIAPGAPGSASGAVDVVAVPAARRADHLVHAAEVAARAGAMLVVLASKHTDPARAHAVASRHLPFERLLVVTQRGRWHVPRAMMRADQLPVSRSRLADTGTKRNLALALALSCGWERLLFLDDDVSGIEASHLRLVRAALTESSGLEAVGWAFDDFPDNSMVCHAYRLAGGCQSTFIGGGALAVRVAAHTPHFPLVYNEDWLFMLPMIMRSRRSVALAGNLSQDEFDPFARPGSAVLQEFGDLLAEGLFRLAHEKRDLSVAHDVEYWREVLGLRAELIDRTARELRQLIRGNPRVPHARAALGALVTARGVHRNPILADNGERMSWLEAMTAWVEAWRQDSQTWADFLASLPNGLGLEAALRRLKLTRYTREGERAAGRTA
jgi:hypothetical protein